MLAIKIAGHFLLKRLKARAEKTGTSDDDALPLSIRKYLLPILYFAAFLLCTNILALSPVLIRIVNMAMLIFATVVGAMFFSRVAVFFLSKYWQKKMRDQSSRLAIKWMEGIVKFLIWGAALLFFLDNIEAKINTLIAGLGIGGLAIAFAAQTILADVFCFFTILFDRPFEPGDFIIAGEHMGTVEHIGLKTTRLRALGGEQLIFSNTDLTASRVRNYKTMERRRVLFTIGVTYDTGAQTLKEIPAMIKRIVESVGDTLFCRAHFFSYGPDSLNFEIAYYILSSDYDKYMDLHQEVNLKIKEEFDKRGIRFAFPTQTLYLNSSAPISAPEGGRFD
jgi:small-conductance mechanosensitive channel